MNPNGREAARQTFGELAAIPTSTIAFGGIAVVVSGAVFAGPWLETRRRDKSVEVVRLGTNAPPGNEGYDELFAAVQGRAFRIAALMTGSLERATSIVEETFARVLQQWTRLPTEARVSYVLSTDVKLSIGRSLIGSLGGPVGTVPAVENDDLLRAARSLSVLEPTRRAIVILSRLEQLTPEEVAQVVAVAPDRVPGEVAAAVAQLGPVFGTVAA
jgi:DNA-directed RNA polymerase specialized sigma24 family protein